MAEQFNPLVAIKRGVESSLSLGRILGNAAYRFYWDDCFSRASSLAYTTLFALVPVTWLAVSMFNVFGLNEEQLGHALQTILEQMLPPIENDQLRQLKEQVVEYLSLFGQNARALNTISIAVLVFTGIALLNTIESALNVVWRVTGNLNVISKIISFWAVITLGPLLFAMSLVWYARVGALTQNEAWAHSEVFSLFNIFVPIASSWLALTLMFYKLPAAKVKLADAALGALISSILFEFVKSAFAYYVRLSTGYSTIYGVLATFPLFLFWLYITWVVILYGAEISYQAGSFKILRGLRKYATDLGEIGAILGLRILFEIGRNFSEGKVPPSEGELAIETGSDPVRVRACLDILTEASILTIADQHNHSRALVVSPDKLLIGDILRTFHSKEHRQLLGNLTGENASKQSSESFLEAFRLACVRMPAEKQVERWSLSELILHSVKLS